MCQLKEKGQFFFFLCDCFQLVLNGAVVFHLMPVYLFQSTWCLCSGLWLYNVLYALPCSSRDSLFAHPQPKPHTQTFLLISSL